MLRFRVVSLNRFQVVSMSVFSRLRFYFAKNELDKLTLVVVSADSDQNDLTDGLIADGLFPCPGGCGNSNDLNS
jgi:hypothetical protein